MERLFFGETVLPTCALLTFLVILDHGFIPVSASSTRFPLHPILFLLMLMVSQLLLLVQHGDGVVKFAQLAVFEVVDLFLVRG